MAGLRTRLEVRARNDRWGRITVIELRAGRPVLRAHNITEHLAPLLEERSLAVSEAREKTGAL